MILPAPGQLPAGGSSTGYILPVDDSSHNLTRILPALTRRS